MGKEFISLYQIRRTDDVGMHNNGEFSIWLLGQGVVNRVRGESIDLTVNTLGNRARSGVVRGPTIDERREVALCGFPPGFLIIYTFITGSIR